MNLKDIKNQFPIIMQISAEPFMVLQPEQPLITTAQGKLSKN